MSNQANIRCWPASAANQSGAVSSIGGHLFFSRSTGPPDMQQRMIEMFQIDRIAALG